MDEFEGTAITQELKLAVLMEWSDHYPNCTLLNTLEAVYYIKGKRTTDESFSAYRRTQWIKRSHHVFLHYSWSTTLKKMYFWFSPSCQPILADISARNTVIGIIRRGCSRNKSHLHGFFPQVRYVSSRQRAPSLDPSIPISAWSAQLISKKGNAVLSNKMGEWGLTTHLTSLTSTDAIVISRWLVLTDKTRLVNTWGRKWRRWAWNKFLRTGALSFNCYKTKKYEKNVSTLIIGCYIFH